MSRAQPALFSYATKGGTTVFRTVRNVPVIGALDPILAALDTRRGALFSSSYEYPGRYTRWEFGFVDPPLLLESKERTCTLRALNERGIRMLPLLAEILHGLEAVSDLAHDTRELVATIANPARFFPEEERSQQPSVFSVIRAIQDAFFSPEDEHLGFYGAFGYDLVFQFEEIEKHQTRESAQSDLILYLPDHLVVVDHRLDHAMEIKYDFLNGDIDTRGIIGDETPSQRKRARVREVLQGSDHAAGQYAAQVRRATEYFRRGDLFEVVPGQTLSEPCDVSPAELFTRLKQKNPSPYGFLINLGREHLIGASPEMYVRVEGRRVETCPISGTIKRGRNPLEDADNIRELLNSQKDESELTMCTDVDRNDKSRICEPGSVRVIGRRQIEMYSRVIHTVDHVEGMLRDGYDAIDAFLTHMWAVTVTGAPKRAAIQFLEEFELSPRRWYGGAVGKLGFNGDMNTGLTLRTIRLENGVAEVRVGATLLADSDPEEEERETRTKASALLDAIRDQKALPITSARYSNVGAGLNVLLVDHQDSFVHTLANYIRQTGANVVTLRAGFAEAMLDEIAPDLVVLSPGPGAPSDFHLSDTLSAVCKRQLPVFGVCLGLQGIVEYFGGTLDVLEEPMHGKPSQIQVIAPDALYDGLPDAFQVGRYHSLYARDDSLPSSLVVTARSEDGVIMSVSHRDLPIVAVQYHPESILTMADDHGLRLIENAVYALKRAVEPALKS